MSLLTPQKLKLSLGIQAERVPGPLWIPKSKDAQVPYRKWHRSVPSRPSPSVDSQLGVENSTGIEKNLHEWSYTAQPGGVQGLTTV